MKELIEKINEKNNWRTDLLSSLIDKTLFDLNVVFMQKVCASENVNLTNISCITLEYTLLKIKESFIY